MLDTIRDPLVQGSIVPVELGHQAHDPPGLNVGQGGQIEDGCAKDVIPVPVR
jgi:hypothetical protein